MTRLAALTTGPGFPSGDFQGTVHSVFPHAVIIAPDGGRLLTVVPRAAGALPAGVTVDADADFSFDGSVARGDAVFDCSDARMCSTACMSDSYCTIDSSGAANNWSVAWARSMSEINCQEAEQCSAACLQGSQRDIDCWRAGTCGDNICAGGSECLLDCTGSADCGFAYCEGGVTACANLYFLGLHWMHTFKSGVIFGVGDDAAYLADRMAATA